MIPLSISGVVAADVAATAVLALPDDLGQAGALTDGVNSVELGETGTFATGFLIYYVPGGQGFTVGGQFLTPPADDDVMDADAWNAQIRAAGCPVVCVSVEEAIGDDEVQVNIRALVRGAAGNDVTLDPDAGNSVSGPTLTGGGGERTIGDLVEAINGETDFPFTAAAEGTAASGTATVAARTNYTGCAVSVTRGGTTLATAPIIASGLNSLAAFVEALNGKSVLTAHVAFSADGQALTATAAAAGASGNGIVVTLRWMVSPMATYILTLAGGVDGEGILLTAKVAGSAGNDLNVRADGCFGYAGAFQGGADASGVVGRVVPFSGGSGGGGYVPAGGKIGTRSTVELDTSSWVVTRRSVSKGEGKCVPPGVVLMQGGRVVYRVPEGVSEYAPGGADCGCYGESAGGRRFTGMLARITSRRWRVCARWCARATGGRRRTRIGCL